MSGHHGESGQTVLSHVAQRERKHDVVHVMVIALDQMFKCGGVTSGKNVRNRNQQRDGQIGQTGPIAAGHVRLERVSVGAIVGWDGASARVSPNKRTTVSQLIVAKANKVRAGARGKIGATGQTALKHADQVAVSECEIVIGVPVPAGRSMVMKQCKTMISSGVRQKIVHHKTTTGSIKRITDRHPSLSFQSQPSRRLKT